MEQNVLILIDWVAIIVFNLIETVMTAYDVNKVSGDPYGSVFDNYSPLKYCLACAIICWVVIAYGMSRHFMGDNFPLSIPRNLDLAIIFGIMWVMWLAAGGAQAAFIDGTHCDDFGDCGEFEGDFKSRGQAEAAFAFLEWLAFTPLAFFAIWGAIKGGSGHSRGPVQSSV